jgi:hypothetical protein
VGSLLIAVAWLGDAAGTARTMTALRRVYRGHPARFPLDAYLAGWPGPSALVDAAIEHQLASPALRRAG